jgi:hypothetical protein
VELEPGSFETEADRFDGKEVRLLDAIQALFLVRRDDLAVPEEDGGAVVKRVGRPPVFILTERTAVEAQDVHSSSLDTQVRP